jgi:hypothetical protein
VALLCPHFEHLVSLKSRDAVLVDDRDKVVKQERWTCGKSGRTWRSLARSPQASGSTVSANWKTSNPPRFFRRELPEDSITGFFRPFSQCLGHKTTALKRLPRASRGSSFRFRLIRRIVYGCELPGDVGSTSITLASEAGLARTDNLYLTLNLDLFNFHVLFSVCRCPNLSRNC